MCPTAVPFLPVRLVLTSRYRKKRSCDIRQNKEEKGGWRHLNFNENVKKENQIVARQRGGPGGIASCDSGRCFGTHSAIITVLLHPSFSKSICQKDTSMSVFGVFKSGVPSNPSLKATSALRYIPKARVPWFPTEFRRENLTNADIARSWSRGRRHLGPGHFNSGYSTETTIKYESQTIPITPKSELQKFMPDIYFGPKAYVTPVSVMSARAGHRITHDLIHSYDPYISRFRKYELQPIDHDNITPHDTPHAGLHPDIISCRARIYRWLRRGPFSTEDWYFRRVTVPNAEPVLQPQDAPTARGVIRLAQKGRLKEACELYRRFTSVPPVEVYRELIAACVPDGLLAEAVAIFEDGARLLYQARDAGVFKHLLDVAIAADHVPRVMWVYNLVRGTFFENIVARRKVEPLWVYQLSIRAMEYLLDAKAGEEARTIYRFLSENAYLRYDLYIRMGTQLRAAIVENKPLSFTDATLDSLPLAQAAISVQSKVLSVFFASLSPEQKSIYQYSSELPTTLADVFEDVDVPFVLRQARFEGNEDLMANNLERFVSRALQWLSLLSCQPRRDSGALPYLRKSKPTAVSPNLRIAAPLDVSAKPKLLPSEDSFTFAFSNATRFVTETFPSVGESLESRYLALQPIHVEVPGYVDVRVPQPPSAPAISMLHHSCFAGSGSAAVAERGPSGATVATPQPDEATSSSATADGPLF